MSVPCVAAGDCYEGASKQERLEPDVGRIFREYGSSFCQKHPQPLSHLRVMQAIQSCRTAVLGGHIDRCSNCGAERISYNSCRNRHCPKCQTVTKLQWLEDRKAEILPVNYFHTVFTLPHELNPLILRNKRVMIHLLFRAVSETLLDFGQNNMGGQLGFITILHTWDQTLGDHFHVHCLIPAGVLSSDKQKWIHTRKNYMFPVKALSKVFRGKFIYFLKTAYSRDELTFPGQISRLESEMHFNRFIHSLWEKQWVVYSKKPFSKPEKVLDYIGRYTHRVAISNHRIVALKDGKVTFTYKDRNNRDKSKTMMLPIYEFSRRFLLHVLPSGLMRIRYFGFMANRCKKDTFPVIETLLGVTKPHAKRDKMTTEELVLLVMGIDIRQCPVCKIGTMVKVEVIGRTHPPNYYPP